MTNKLLTQIETYGVHRWDGERWHRVALVALLDEARAQRQKLLDKGDDPQDVVICLNRFGEYPPRREPDRARAGRFVGAPRSLSAAERRGSGRADRRRR
jgi:hypothetical protein